MRRGKANKFPCRYDLGFLPESRKMFLICGNEVVRPRRIGAFKEHIVIRVAGDFQAPRWLHDMAMVFDELQQLPPHSLANTQLLAPTTQPTNCAVLYDLQVFWKSPRSCKLL
jgi:hypothetical protein